MAHEHLAQAVTDKSPDPHPFSELYPSLIGPDEARQFVTHQGELYCLRPTCDGCPYDGNGCEFEEEDLPQSAIPHPRRGVGFEERPFLILFFREGQSFATMPRDLWDNPFSDKAFAHSANLHWAYTDPKTAKFHTLKGQLRFYGDRAEFSSSPWAEFLDVHDDYEPQHNIVSMDYSAIEPRVSTLVSREPEWIEVFKGKPKVIFREVDITPGSNADRPGYIRDFEGQTYCYLKGELDKETFEGQCKKCPLSLGCTVKEDFHKDVPTDWHGINTEGLYGDEFSKNPDPYAKKDLRGIGKIVGLALTYGGSAWTVARNMGSTVEQAQFRIDNFFRKLTVLKQYMDGAKAQVRVTGRVSNLFGRQRDLSKKVFSQAVDERGFPDHKQRRKDVGYAERSALNGPIQGTASDLLKIGHIRADVRISAERWFPLTDDFLPARFEKPLDYRDLICCMASSIHDEVMFLIRSDRLDDVIPYLYIAMQLGDIMKQSGIGYTLELDCEYDKTRSWTAGTAFNTAEIYLLRQLKGMDGADKPRPPKTVARANLALVHFSDVTPDFLRGLMLHDASGGDTGSQPVYGLGVLFEGSLYPHGGSFTQATLDTLGVPYRLVGYFSDQP